jgi:histone-lysine N-methyltransferase SETD1
MNQELAFGLMICKSPIDDQGCFATIRFPKGGQIAEYTGEKITRGEALRRMRGRRRNQICGVDLGWCIDGNVGGNGTQYINHSCEPNCDARLVQGRILLFALRDIAPGEEITADYGRSFHTDRKKCRCQSPSCRGTINYIEKAMAPEPSSSTDAAAGQVMMTGPGTESSKCPDVLS